MNNEIVQIRSNVPLWRRAGALLLDSLFLSFVVIIAELCQWNYWITLAIYSAIDFIIIPHKTGYTLSRWIVGYTIQSIQGNYCRIGSLLIRSLLIFTLVYLAPVICFFLYLVYIDRFPWFDLFIIVTLLANFALFPLFYFTRKDRRFIYEIVTKTQVSRSEPSQKSLRLLSISLIVYLFISFTAYRGAQGVYHTYIFPLIQQWKDEVTTIEKYHTLPISGNTNNLFSIPNTPFKLSIDDSIIFNYTDSILTINHDSFKIQLYSSTFPHPLRTDSLEPEEHRRIQLIETILGEKRNTATQIQYLLETAFFKEPAFSLLNPRKTARQIFSYLNSYPFTLLKVAKIPIRKGIITNNEVAFFIYSINKNADHVLVFSCYKDNQNYDILFHQLGDLESDASINYIIENIQFDLGEQQ